MAAVDPVREDKAALVSAGRRAIIRERAFHAREQRKVEIVVLALFLAGLGLVFGMAVAG